MAQHSGGTSSWWWAHRNKLLGASAVAAASYWAYQTYGRQDSTVNRLSRATRKYCEAYETTADLVSLLAADLKQFLTTDQTETPQSLQQLAKLLQRDEVQQTVQTFVRSVAAAVQPSGESASAVSDVVDKLVAGLLSEQGRSLVGLAVAKAAKHSTAAVCDFVGQRLDAAAAAAGPDAAATAADSVAQVLRVLASDDGERLLRVVVGEGMSRAVDAYMSAATPDNYYDDVLGSLARPEHTAAVKDIVGAISGTFARELVGGFMQASAAQQRRQRQADASTSYAPAAAGGDAASSSSGASDAGDAAAEEELHDSVKSLTPAFARCRLEADNPQWLTTVAQLSRQPEVQALAVEMTKTSVREAVGSVLRPFLGQFGSAGGPGSQVALSAWLQRMYTMASVMLSLLLYMCST